jgi:lipopolysaccharide/colanic/teichoic acid biosynthesis glycosyltransferase
VEADVNRALGRGFPAIVAAGLVVALAAPQKDRIGPAVLVALLVGGTDAALTRHAPRAAFLAMVRTLYPAAGAFATLVMLLLLKATVVLPGVTIAECFLLCGVTAFVTLAGRAALQLLRGQHDTRVAVVGSSSTAEALAQELRRLPRANSHLAIIGYLSPLGARQPRGPTWPASEGGHEDDGTTPESVAALADPSEPEPSRRRRSASQLVARCLTWRWRDPRDRAGTGGAVSAVAAPLPELGTERDVALAVKKHDIELLVLADEASRMTFFAALGAATPDVRPRAVELSALYERVFGHVPLGSINATWFQSVLDPQYAGTTGPAKRTLDLAITLAVGIVAAPMLAVLALLIRRDGGPVLYRQTRIGEAGRPFEILKLRTMRVDATSSTNWCEPDDSRVTGIGRFLRKSHLDELPQLWNVLRGEMSIVGPRPEQGAYVDQLERALPFYSRRHLAQPGITGWAQISCGYAGSEQGSIWKLSHDLYYLKHRSFGLDILILIETVRTLFADRQFPTDVPVPALVYEWRRPVAAEDVDDDPTGQSQRASRIVSAG